MPSNTVNLRHSRFMDDSEGNISTGPASPPDFAHPAEKTFSAILDFYGVQWEYEPRTFALHWDEQNHMIEGFTPDFYLPHQDLYIELTTLRPKLISHKNRKIRRMKELYPEVNVRLLKRREMRDLMVKFGLEQEADRIIGNQAQDSIQS